LKLSEEEEEDRGREGGGYGDGDRFNVAVMINPTTLRSTSSVSKHSFPNKSDWSVWPCDLIS
jgi:hypothetical protein